MMYFKLIKRNFSQNLRVLAVAIVSLSFGITGYSQMNVDFNRISLEVKGGYQIPTSPQNKSGRSLGDYANFNQYEVAGRYMISERVGLKAFYGFSGFEGDGKVMGNYKPGEIDSKNSFTRIGIEGMLNLGDLFEMDQGFLEKNGLHGHAGGGILSAKPSDARGSVDRVGFIQFGATGLRKLSSSFALMLDVTYLINLKQHYGFDGVLLSEDPSVKVAEVGGLVSVNLGLVFYIGGRSEHADWYW